MRGKVSALVVLAAGAIVLSQVASASSHPPLTERQILSIALRAAVHNGDPRPTLIQHSEGTRCEANRIASGGCDGGSNQSYLIAERGTFIGYGASVPSGASIPRGSVITLVVNASTGDVTDGGISYRYPPLAQLGPVTTDWRTYPACPVSDRQPLVSTTRGSAAELVPAGALQVLLCRYSGVNPIPSAADRLVAHRLVGSRLGSQRLAAEFDALKPVQPGSYSCPVDFGVEIIAIFRYASRSDDPVALDPNGCTSVTNGHVDRTAGFAPGPHLISQLEALTAGRSPSPTS